MINYKQFIFIFFGFISSLAFTQNIWYVSENGSNSSGNGTESNPWATITKAMGESSVQDNDSIYIIGSITADGDAEWGIQVMKDLVFIGEDKETSIIQAAGSKAFADRRVMTIWDIADVQLINLTIQNGYFDVNSFQFGAGILNWGNLLIENCIITENYCETEFLGGGIYNQFGTLSISNTYLYSNYSLFGGAGIISEGGVLNMRGSSVALNYCQQNLAGGAGLYVTDNAEVSIVNSTFYYNLLGLNSYGAGIYIKADDGNINVDILNTTIAGNEAGAGSNGMGIFIDNATSNTIALTLKNCIISNGSSMNFGQDGGGVIQINRSFTLCKDISFPDGNSNGNLDNTDPLIDSFMNHGGLTPTCSLEQTSPAINSGTDDGAPETDQRGMPRSGITDMGSFEYQINIDISQAKQKNELFIYPNPAHDFIIINSSKTISTNIQFHIYNIRGSRVQQYKQHFSSQSILLDISMLSRGIYFIEILSEGNHLAYIKYVKE